MSGPRTAAHVRSRPPPVIEIAPVNADACRALWAAVLFEQWRFMFPRKWATTVDVRKQEAAAAWFASRDCAQVCALIGIDVDYVRRKLAEMLADVAAGKRDAPGLICRQADVSKRKSGASHERV